VLLREKLGVTLAHISNGGFAGYGPGFWGPGHDPFTHAVLGPDEVDMSKVIGALGFHSERVREPTEIIPALRRALAANALGRPAPASAPGGTDISYFFPPKPPWGGRGGGGGGGATDPKPPPPPPPLAPPFRGPRKEERFAPQPPPPLGGPPAPAATGLPRLR